MKIRVMGKEGRVHQEISFDSKTEYVEISES